MRFLASFLLLFLPIAAWPVTTIDVSALNTVTATMAITSTEDTLTLTISNGFFTTRRVQIVCDQAWGIGTTTGAFSTKVPISANQPLTLKLNNATQSFFVQASSTSGTLHIIVLDNQ